MINLSPVPNEGESYWFFADDQIKINTAYLAKVLKIYPFSGCSNKFIYKYDDLLEEVVPYPLMDLWLDGVIDTFWILENTTDFIIELYIPELCPQNVYIARDVDGGWHAFETTNSKQFGFLDITGEIHKELINKTLKTKK